MARVTVSKESEFRLRTAIQKLSKGLDYEAEPTFAGLTLTGLTASRLLSTDASKKLASVPNLTSWITGTTNEITVTDDGDGTVTLSLPQAISSGSTPTFAGIIIADGGTIGVTDGPAITFNINEGITGENFVLTGGELKVYHPTLKTLLVFENDSTDKVRIQWANDNDKVWMMGMGGSIGDVNFPTDTFVIHESGVGYGLHIAPGSEVTFRKGLTLGGNLTMPNDGIIDAHLGKVLVTDNATSEPGTESDGYIGVAMVGGQPRIYFAVDGDMYYVEGSASTVITTGSPIGLLLTLTYNLE